MLFRPEKWSSCKVIKNRHFAKGLVHCFCQQIELFFICFFLTKKGQKETFFDILDSNECFLDLISEVCKRVEKNRHFAKG